MKHFYRALRFLFIFLVLTAFTQIGGLVYLAYKPLGKYVSNRLSGRLKYLRVFVFVAFYLLVSLIVVPPLAKQFGRVPLPKNNPKLTPATHLTWICNRHYVKPTLLSLLDDVANSLPEGMSVVYLDANFPFIDGFPLIGHLSHDDGEKVDLAFIYSNNQGAYLNDGKTFTGFGHVEGPKKGEINQPQLCAEQGYWQYSFASNWSWVEQAKDYEFDAQANQLLLRKLAKDPRTGKIFIEPHLTKRLKLQRFSKVRFHGCHAARHDDHIHLQL